MKDERDLDKGGGVRKFLYSGPPKKETLPQQWSHQLSKSHSNPNATLGENKSFNLDRVWSIKKNMSVDSKKKDEGNDSFLSVRYNTSLKNAGTFYSRHKSTTTIPTVPAKGQLKVAVSDTSTSTKNGRQQKAWLRGSANTHSNASSSPQHVFTDDDEFDFDFPLPSSKAKNWNNISTDASSPKSSHPYSYSDASKPSERKTNPLEAKFSTGNYGSKYNASFPFDF